MKNKGWKGESQRHGLAARGIGGRFSFPPEMRKIPKGVCPDCLGDGEVENDYCYKCLGTGRSPVKYMIPIHRDDSRYDSINDILDLYVGDKIYDFESIEQTREGLVITITTDDAYGKLLQIADRHNRLVWPVKPEGLK